MISGLIFQFLAFGKGLAVVVDHLHAKGKRPACNGFTNLSHANDAQRAELQKWVDAKEFDRNEKVAAVTRLYNEIGIDKLALDKIAYYFEQSKKYLDAVNVPADRKEELAKYAQKMMKPQMHR